MSVSPERILDDCALGSNDGLKIRQARTGHPKSDFTTLRHRRAATEAGAGLTLVNNSLVAWHRLPALDAADVGG